MDYKNVVKVLDNVDNIVDFDNDINNYLNDGYRLVGSIQVLSFNEKNVIVQSIVKDNELEDFEDSIPF